MEEFLSHSFPPRCKVEDVTYSMDIPAKALKPFMRSCAGMPSKIRGWVFSQRGEADRPWPAAGALESASTKGCTAEDLWDGT
jgi:hypothetical protein